MKKDFSRIAGEWICRNVGTVRSCSKKKQLDIFIRLAGKLRGMGATGKEISLVLRHANRHFFKGRLDDYKFSSMGDFAESKWKDVYGEKNSGGENSECVKKLNDFGKFALSVRWPGSGGQTDLRILLFLTNTAKEHVTEYVSVSTRELSEYTCIKRSATAKSLRRLVKAGWISISRRHDMFFSTIYHLCVDSPPKTADVVLKDTTLVMPSKVQNSVFAKKTSISADQWSRGGEYGGTALRCYNVMIKTDRPMQEKEISSLILMSPTAVYHAMGKLAAGGIVIRPKRGYWELTGVKPCETHNKRRALNILYRTERIMNHAMLKIRGINAPSVLKNKLIECRELCFLFDESMSTWRHVTRIIAKFKQLQMNRKKKTKGKMKLVDMAGCRGYNRKCDGATHWRMDEWQRIMSVVA